MRVEVPLWLKTRHVSEEEFVLLTSKVSFSGFFTEQVPLDVFNFIFTEKYVCLNFSRLKILKILIYFVTPFKFGIGIIYQNPAHFFPRLIFIFFFLLLLVLNLRILHIINIFKLFHIILLSLRRIRHDHLATLT